MMWQSFITTAFFGMQVPPGLFLMMLSKDQRQVLKREQAPEALRQTREAWLTKSAPVLIMAMFVMAAA